MIEENVVSSAGTVYHLSLEEIRGRSASAATSPASGTYSTSISTTSRPMTGRRRCGSRRWPVDARTLAGAGRPTRPPGSIVIQVDSLCKSFLDYQRGWVAAVADVTFECQPGAIFGLLGPNGAGKTTTLRILSTVLKPTSGRAIVAGHDVLTEPEEVRASIGYMSASTGIYDRMTAWELVEYFGQLYGLTARAAARADGDDLRLAPDERLPRRPRLEDVDRDEAEGLDRPDDRPRSARS